MYSPDADRWLRDARGHPSRWIALAFAAIFGAGAVAAALLGQGHDVTLVLGMLFVVCFNVAFGRRPVAVQVASALARRPSRR
jgi:hypothetical protein